MDKIRLNEIKFSDMNFLKKNWFGCVTIAFSLIVLVAAVFATGEKDAFFAAIKNMDQLWILVAFVFVFAYWLLDALTLNILTATMYKKYAFLESFKTGMIGLLYSALTPFSTGGQPMQIYEMNKTGVKTGDACSVITVKSILYQGVMTLYGVAASFITWQFFHDEIPNFFVFVFFGTVTNIVFICCILFICIKKNFTKSCIVMLIRLLRRLRLVKDEAALIKRAYSQVDVFYESVRALRNKTTAFILGIFITFAQLTIFYAIPFCVYKGFHLDAANFVYMIAANALIAMITAFVPIPGAAGAAESSFYIFFAIFFEDALLLSAVLVWRVITYYSCIIAGAMISAWMISAERRQKIKTQAMGRRRKKKKKR